MICRLCLCNTENYIEFFDSYGLSVSAADIVGKHFWFVPKQDDSMSNFICAPCWDIVKDFHNLYKTVEKAHRLLNEKLLVSVKQDPNEFLNSDGQNNRNAPENRDNGLYWDNIADLRSESTEDTFKPTILKNIATKIIIKIEKPQLKARGRKSKKKNFQTIQEEVTDKNLIRNITHTSIKENQNDSDNNEYQDYNKSKEKAQANIKLIEEDKKIASFMNIICELCQVECTNFSNLKSHFLTNHKQKGFVICCNRKFFKRSILVDHVEKHINPESFKCNLCNKVCMSRCTLRLHIARVHEIREPEHQCSYCGKSFKLNITLKRHQLTHIPDEEKKFKCIKCEKRYPSEKILSDHIKVCHDKGFAGICDICGKVYKRKVDCRRHRLEIHEGVARKNVKCKLCSKEFEKRYQYNLHRAKEHSNPNVEYKCKHCGKISPNSEALRKHVQKIHRAKLKFFCSFCNKVFKSDLHLKEHQTTHTGEPLYVCPHCPRTFTHSSNMHHHRKRAHPVEFEEARQRKNERKESWLQITALQS